MLRLEQTRRGRDQGLSGVVRVKPTMGLFVCFVVFNLTKDKDWTSHCLQVYLLSFIFYYLIFFETGFKCVMLKLGSEDQAGFELTEVPLASAS